MHRVVVPDNAGGSSRSGNGGNPLIHGESRITSDGTVFIQVDLPPEF